MKISLIVPCAGSGKRMNADHNKMLMKLEGQTVLGRTLKAFDSVEEIMEIVLVIREEDRADIDCIVALTACRCPVKLTVGGKERQDSVRRGLDAVDAEMTHVMIHDGARPFVSRETIQRTLKALSAEDAVCVGVPTKDTLKKVDAERKVLSTPDRTDYWNVQTPQAFERHLLERAYDYAASKGFQGTDDASLVEYMGSDVRMVLGTYDNIKITTLEDLAFGKAILSFRNQEVQP